MGSYGEPMGASKPYPRMKNISSWRSPSHPGSGRSRVASGSQAGRSSGRRRVAGGSQSGRWFLAILGKSLCSEIQSNFILGPRPRP